MEKMDDPHFYNYNLTLTRGRKIRKFEPQSSLRRNQFIYYFTTDPNNTKYGNGGKSIPHPEFVRTAMREKEKRYSTGDTANSKLTRNLRKKISVPDVPDGITTITDTDPDFYTIVEGRPVKNKQNLREYTEELRLSALANLQTGHLKDEALKYEERALDERRVYDKTRRLHNECADIFERLLGDSFQNATVKLKQSESSKAELAQKTEECKNLEVELGKVVRKIYVLEERNRFAKIYQRFLNHVSPLSWCRENNIELITAVLNGPNNLFSGYGSDPNDRFPTLARSIEMFKLNHQDTSPPKIYFTEPSQILKIIRNAEIQNLTNWSNSEEFKKNTKKVQDNVENLHDSLKKEFTSLQESIDNVKDEIENEEKYLAALKNKTVDFLKKEFHKMVASDQRLMVNVSVEHIYEKVVFPNVTFEAFEMMKRLELEYELNMIKLDNINPEVVASEKQYNYTEDIKIMKVAREAAIKLKNLDKLFKQLKKDL